jgi:hypothetical protein
MSNIGFIELNTIIDEYIDDYKIDQDLVSEESLKTKAADCTEWFNTTQQLKYNLGLFTTNHVGRFKVPDDLRTIQQVAYKIPKSKDQCTTSGQLVGWIQHDYASGMDIEVTVKCGKCGKKDCKCEGNPIIIDVDDYWNRINMIDNVSSKRAIKKKFGHSHDGFRREDEWRLIRHTINDFQNNSLPSCHNLDFRGCDEFSYALHGNYLATDLPKNAEVLLSYLSVETDEDGDILVPNIPDAVDAVKFHLAYKHFESKYFGSQEDKDLKSSQVFELKRERAIELARNELQLPEYLELYSILDQVFYRQLNGATDKLTTHHRHDAHDEDLWLT